MRQVWAVLSWQALCVELTVKDRAARSAEWVRRGPDFLVRVHMSSIASFHH